MSYGNRRTRNPGWQRGGHWVVCDVCGATIRSKDAKKTWEGYVVCPNDYETRHPQDFVRSLPDTTAPVGDVRTDPDEIYSLPTCTDRYCVAGDAETGCAIAGLLPTIIPAGTFTD